jgi:AraC-like DNA-binding protein
LLAGNFQYRKLEHYLRLANASPSLWLAGLAHFMGGHELTLCTRPQGFGGTISWLASAGVRIAVLETNVEFVSRGANAADPAIVVVLAGHITVSSDAAEVSGGTGTGFLLPPLAGVEVKGSEDLRVLVAQLVNPSAEPLRGNALQQVSVVPVNLLMSYLRRADFFRSHQHALSETGRLGQRLRQFLCQPPEPGMEKTCLAPELDRRVVRAVDLVASVGDKSFSMEQLAATAGMSTRNLYYLMKKHTGMTPHQLVVSRRLISVRRALLECDCDVPTVSWHALSEGFGHLGRFSALYRKHFGEYPRETLQWRHIARHNTRIVRPAGCSGDQGRLCLTAG